MKLFPFFLMTLISVSSFANVKTRLGIDADFSEVIKPSDVVAVHGSCQMNDHVRNMNFEFTNFQTPPGQFDYLVYDFNATYPLKHGGIFHFATEPDAEPVLSLGWQERNDGGKARWIMAYFGKSGPDTVALSIDALEWTSPFQFSVSKKTVTIATKNTWIKLYDPKGTNYEPLTGGDCTWVLDLK